MALKPLNAIIRAIDRWSGPMGRMQKSLDRFGRRAGRVGRGLTRGLSLPIAAVGIAAGKLTADFDDSLSQIVGLVGVNRDVVAGWREDILKLAPAVGKSPGELAKGLFFVASAGLRGQDALDLLTASAQASVAGMGDVDVIAGAASSAMAAFKGENLGAAQAVAILVGAVREGKASAETLAPAIGRVIPLAAEMKIGFDQVAGAIAAMTRLGANAEESVTSLRAIMVTLANPTKKTEKVFKAFGLSATALRQQIREKGLLSVLLTLRDRFGQNERAMGAAFPNVRALVGVLNLVGQNAKVAEEIFASLAGTTEKDLAKAFAAAQTPGQRFRVLFSSIQVAMIRLGDVILPKVVPLVEMLTKRIESLAGWFEKLLPGQQTFLLVSLGLVAVVGPLLVVFGALAAAVAAVGVPVALVISGITALVALITTVVVRWEDFKRSFTELPAGLRKIFAGEVDFGFTQPELAAFGGPIAAGGAAAPIETRNEVRGTIGIHVDAEGRTRVTELEAAGGIELDVDTGMAMAIP